MKVYKNSPNLTGRKFGNLIALCRYESGLNGKSAWICKCDCGNKKVVRTTDLLSGKTKSCGCMRSASAKNTGIKNAIHGMSGSRLYKIWGGMKRRHRISGFEHAIVCEEWQDFRNFFKWAMDNGYTDELTIDRIDNKMGYSPDNCRWATYKEQENNRTNNHTVTIDGVSKTLAQWSDETGIRSETLAFRIKSGWPISDLLIPTNYGNSKIRREQHHA